MFKKLSASALCVAAAVTFGAGTAQAVSMSDLVAGTALVTGPVTFSAFDYTDVGGGFGDFAVEPADIDVTTFGSAGNAGLLFTTSIAMGIDEALEMTGNFLVSVAGGGSLTNVTFGIVDAVMIGGDSFTEIGSNSHVGAATVTDTVLAPQSYSVSLASLSSVLVNWDVQGESGGDAGSSVNLSQFSIAFDYTAPVIMPPSADVPLPASLPLLFVGLAGLGYMRRRG